MGQPRTYARDQLQKTFESSVNSFAIVPADAVGGNQLFHALWVGGAGDVVVVNDDGTLALFKAVAAGTRLPVSGIRVNNTNTTATFIIGMQW